MHMTQFHEVTPQPHNPTTPQPHNPTMRTLCEMHLAPGYVRCQGTCTHRSTYMSCRSGSCTILLNVHVDLLVRHLYMCMTLQVHEAHRRESGMWSRVQTTFLRQGQRYDFHVVNGNHIQRVLPSRKESPRSLHGQHVKTAGYAPG